MANYRGIRKKEALMAQVLRDYFAPAQCGAAGACGTIDCIVTEGRGGAGGLGRPPYLWAKAALGTHDPLALFTRLLLGGKKTYDRGASLPPSFIGCFDTVKIAFAPFPALLPLFAENDINWHTPQGDCRSAAFVKIQEKLAALIAKTMVVFDFDEDSESLKQFIKRTLMPVSSADQSSRAALPSEGGEGMIAAVKRMVAEAENAGQCDFSLGFSDGGEAHRDFWNTSQRFSDGEEPRFSSGRPDPLAAQSAREERGAFFTPPLWVEQSHDYLEQALGPRWQEDYYVWDCAAGTGNLLAGLTNKPALWASTLDQSDLEVMRGLIGKRLQLLPDQVFRFDFLNDPFEDLPEGLRRIIDDPEKRRKLIVYINPPYAEATSAATVAGTGKNKTAVATQHRAHAVYKRVLGRAANELFSLFMARIMHKLGGAYLAVFSKLKYLNSSNFAVFRAHFSAQFITGFMCRADTFDNVTGKFPIGFLIWRLSAPGSVLPFPKTVTLAVRATDGRYLAEKGFYNGARSINKWIREFDCAAPDALGFMGNPAPDFLAKNQPSLSVRAGTRHFSYFAFKAENLIEGCIYYAVRLCIEPTWINDRDQFLYPDGAGWKEDPVFQHDCLVFTLFHRQNRISCADGVNHWIPFTEGEVGAKEQFASAFMSGFLKGRAFSPEAQAVLDAGRELWKYYHAKIKDTATASVNASFYDIREFFQGRKESGVMKTRSEDEAYNTLRACLRCALKALTAQTAPKVYEYGFVKE